MYGVRQFEAILTRPQGKGLRPDGKPSNRKPGSGGCDRMMEDLSYVLKRTIEGEILPRLMLAHREVAQPRKAEATRQWAPGPDSVQEFASLILQDAEDGAVEYIENLIGGGVPLDEIYLSLLAPAARVLGDWWVEDRCNFVEVTIGLARLEHLLHLFNREFEGSGPVEQVGGTALFSVAPGEQHTYGISMLGEFFRRDGWSVWCGVPSAADEVSTLVNEEWFDVVGLSLSRESLLDRVKKDIENIRGVSKNPLVQVLVGGRVFSDNPKYVDAVGADHFAQNARQAVSLANKLVELLPRQC